MKRNLLIGLLLLAAGSMSLRAQDAALTPAAQELNLQNFWFNSSNAAGMAMDPMQRYNNVSLQYDRRQGDFKNALDAATEGGVTAATSGVLSLKGFVLYGDFSYNHNTSKGSLYNANIFEPTYKMPYYLADWNLSDWRRQTFDMGVKVAAPKMANDRLALGLTIRYNDKVGAKQMDPRAVTYVLNLQAAPSLAFALSPSATLGLTLDYERYKERTRHSCENYLVTQPAALMRGLGYFTNAIIGGNMGVGDLLYSGNRFGGALSFEGNGSAADLFAEVAGGYETIEVMERPSFPRMRGKTATLYGDLTLKGNFGASRNHRVSLTGSFSQVTGSEYTQELVTSPKRMWYTVAVTPMSTYTFADAALNYDFYKNISDAGYDWKLGAEVDFSMMNQVYMVSYFKNMSVDADVHFAYNFAFAGGSNLLAQVKAGYYYPLSGGYLYTGTTNNDSEIVNSMYPKELAYLTSQCLDATAGATYSFPITKQLYNLYISAKAQYRKPLGANGDRLMAVATVGMLF